MSQNVSKTKMLTEAAVMLAVATVLSLIKLLDLPYGGSVTIASMLPIVIIAYRHGIKLGLLTGFAFGIIQQLLGLNTLSYVTSWQSVIAVILLDYIIAFTVIGFGGLFKKISSQPTGLLYGALIACALRYICHVISGCTVWAGLSIPTNAAFIYSLGYNATYMIPETIVTASLAYLLGSVLDFRQETITNIHMPESEKPSVLRLASIAVITIALIYDARMLFLHLQNAETGEFDLSGIAVVQWRGILAVSCIAISVALVLFMISSGKKASKQSNQ